jgi:hypothetical protein
MLMFFESNINFQMKHKSPTVRVSAMQILGKKCIANANLYPRLVKSWVDKNSRVRREIMNGIGIVITDKIILLFFVSLTGNFVKSNPQNLSIAIDPDNMRIFDKNSNHVWNSLSYYWQQSVEEPSIVKQEKNSNDDESDSV